MNPEFQRNLWLELTTNRMAMMAGVLLLVFFAAAAPGSFWPSGTRDAARALFYGIVVLWGTRNAALSVIGEIRERTWDFQRLSSLSPEAMTFGKLFGSTIYNWFGGAICLVVMAGSMILSGQAAAALFEVIFAVCVGVVAQSAALLASLVAIRRRQTHTRRDIFLYQAVGLLAAALAYGLWQGANPLAILSSRGGWMPDIAWWGVTYDARLFFLVSLGLLLGWLLTGCYRAMRLELKMRNGQAVWIAFLVFIGIYVAGFEPRFWLPRQEASGALLGWRVVIVGITYMLITYAMVLFEPKDRVHFRWLAGQFTQRNYRKLFDGLQSWMIAYAATVLTVPVIYLYVQAERFMESLAIIAMLGFLTRDIGIFILMQTRTGKASGDYAALVALVVLYGLLPSIFRNGGIGLQFLFYPSEDAALLGLVAAWAQAAAVLFFAFQRLALPEPQLVRK